MGVSLSAVFREKREHARVEPDPKSQALEQARGISAEGGESPIDLEKQPTRLSGPRHESRSDLIS